MHRLLFLLLLLPAGGLASAVSSAVCANNDCWCGSDATRAAYECKQGDAKYKCTNPGSTSYCAALTAKGFPLYSCLSNITCSAPSPSPSPTPAPPGPAPPAPAPPTPADAWLLNFGRDTFTYPKWITVQMDACRCTFSAAAAAAHAKATAKATDKAEATDNVNAEVGAEGGSSAAVEPLCLETTGGGPFDPLHSHKAEWRTATSLRFCSAKQWLLEHMPSFDRYFLPPSVTVRGARYDELRGTRDQGQGQGQGRG